MNPGSLTLLAYILTSLAALGCLCLTMPRNNRRCLGRFLPHRALRWSGWSLMTLLTLVAFSTQSWGFGLVSVLGALSLSAFAVVALLTYRPEWLLPGTLGSSLAGLLLLGVSVLAL